MEGFVRVTGGIAGGFVGRGLRGFGVDDVARRCSINGKEVFLSNSL